MTWIEADKAAEEAVANKLALIRDSGRMERLLATITPRKRLSHQNREAEYAASQQRAKRETARQNEALTNATALLRTKMGTDLPELVRLLKVAGWGHNRLVNLLEGRTS